MAEGDKAATGGAGFALAEPLHYSQVSSRAAPFPSPGTQGAGGGLAPTHERKQGVEGRSEMHSLPTLSGLFLGSQLPSGVTTTLLARSHFPAKMLTLQEASSPLVQRDAGVGTGRKKPLPCESLTPWMRMLPLVVTPFATFVFQD